MRVIYLTGPIGSKRNGGSGLSGLRFLELLMARYGKIHIVTDANRNAISPRPSCSVTKIKGRMHDFGGSARSIARAIAVRLINLPRPRHAVIDGGGERVLVVCNSFTEMLDRLQIRNAKSVRLACVVRGDTNSFDYQGWGDSEEPLKKPLEFLNRFDQLIFVSQTIKRNWEKLLTQPKKLFVLPNAIDETEVDELMRRSEEEVRASLGWKPGEVHIVVVGSLQRRKGQDIFVQAAGDLFRAVPHCRVHFVGVVSAPWGGVEIAKALNEAGGDRFVVHGHREDALSLVRAADVAVMVSRSEAFPRTVAEYTSLGKAIITTPVAGADEMVIDGETGIIIPIGDSKALTEALVAVSADAGLRRRLGEAARSRYFSEYSMEYQEKQFANIFDEVDEEFHN